MDWDAGSYETTTGPEIEPVSEVVAAAAAIAAGEEVIDLAAGTGNGALAAARRGARVTVIDGAPRLLAIAAQRAEAESLELDVREGDLLRLPVDDAAADAVISVFGIIFASEPAAALREVRRVLRPHGRLVLSAWVPAGPVDTMLGAIGRIVARVTGAPPPQRFAWQDPAILGPVAADAGLSLGATTAHALPIRDKSPDSYVERSRDHPMAVAVEPAVAAAGIGEEVCDAQLSVLRAANEDPDGFLIHSPYVVHELRVTAAAA